jgi:3-isopropylmalate/(R)-2-methylmalate dehydratase large subunit
MEFTGEAIDALPMDDRFTMANMAIEAGAKTAIFHVDEATKQYVKPRAKRSYKIYEPDKDAQYQEVIEYDVNNMEPQIALPSLPMAVLAIYKLRLKY